MGLNRHRLPIADTGAPGDTPVDMRDAKPYPAAQPLRPPTGAPNVLVILIDDMGFGASTAFGGPCEMPNAERLATDGARFTRFHTTALCSPTRQALLTGRNHHSAGMGVIAEIATSSPGYCGVRPDTCGTIAQTLRMNGYSTAAFGKMHQTPPWETSPSGPFDRWPTNEGFDRFYGFLGGDCSQYNPPLIDGTTHIDPPKTPEEGYHLSEDLTDQLISWTGSIGALTPDKPWFAYLSFGATHAPHHAPKEWIDRYRGRFDHGYDEQRAQTLERQKELGVVPHDAELTAPNELIPSWEELTEQDRMVGTRLMEAYAGFASHTDHQVGRVLDALEAQGVLDDTLVFYILGDNGASAEAGAYGTFNEMAYQNNVQMTSDQILERIDEIGSPSAFNHVPAGWAHALCAPYQWSKIVASHWGGTRTGMIARWPGHIDGGGTRDQFVHVIDLVPTILEAAGIPAPEQVNGIEQRALEGTSMGYLFGDETAEERHRTQYFEIAGNRGIYHDGWSAVTMHTLPWPDPDFTSPPFTEDDWELYAPGDWTQARNVAAKQPEKLRELQDRFLIEAAKYNVLPLDDRQRERFDPRIAGRPDLLGDRTSMTLRPGMGRLNENTVPNVKNTDFTVTATVTLPPEPANGAIVAQGGAFGGWALYLRDGVPTYAHNWVGLETFIVGADAPVGAGDHVIELRFTYDGGGVGKGGDVELRCDGAAIGGGRIEKTVPALFSFDDCLDIGYDGGETVVPDYGSPGGAFTGSIETVVIDVDPATTHDDPELLLQARYRKQ